jgi:hypothetical protein
MQMDCVLNVLKEFVGDVGRRWIKGNSIKSSAMSVKTKSEGCLENKLQHF